MKVLNRIISIWIFVAVFAFQIQAQMANKGTNQIPFDPDVRFGKLANGLTYYVLKNQEPKDRASFYIVQNVGASLEKDDQDGLAHFLEHMAFNGTKNFPDKALLKYLEQYGVAFGRNINAFTSLDRTVYNLSDVPANKPQVLDSALLILHDWANEISLIDSEIDKERGVITEEWRTYESGSQRVYIESLKYIYKGSRYAERDVIGDINIIKNFKYQTIKDFYNEWYRTDLQAIIVIGDFDPQVMEEKIKQLFSKIEPVKNPSKREYLTVPDNTAPIVGIVTDKEESSVSFELYIKQNAVPFNQKDIAYYRERLIRQIYSEVMRNRIAELMQKGNPPFASGVMGYYNMIPTMDVYYASATLKAENIMGGIDALLTENERVVKFGVLESELQRAKTAILSRKEAQFKDRFKQRNDNLVWAYANHFLTNEPAPGIENDFNLTVEVLPQITLTELNKRISDWNKTENVVLFLSGPTKEGLVYPTESELLKIYQDSKLKTVTPYTDMVISEPLVGTINNIGKVVSEKKLEGFDATEWVLSNGAKVIIKSTNFKDNEIMLRGVSFGGKSMYSDNMPSVNFAADLISSFGLAKFDAVSLNKYLTGKIARVSIFVGDWMEGVNGSSSVQDFEVMLQLLYSHFEQKRSDKEAFEALRGRYVAYVENMSNNNDNVFNDSVQRVLTSYSNRTVLFNAESLKAVDFNMVNKVYTERIADASDFVFVFVGNINPADAKPLIEKYIGGITAKNRNEKFKVLPETYPKKTVIKHFTRDMQTPKTSYFININSPIKFNYSNKIMLNLVTQLLDKKYIERIREDEGGTYGAAVYNQLNKYPNEDFDLIISFDTDPEKADKLVKIVYEEIENLCNGKISAVHLKEAKEFLLKQREEQLRDNGFWMNTLIHNYVNVENILTSVNYVKAINDITEKQITSFAKKYLKSTVNVEVKMSPTQK